MTLIQEENEYRNKIACLAKDVIAGKLTFRKFLGQVREQESDRDPTNDDVDELVDLLAHAPKLGGWFGVSQNEYDKYYMEINKTIEKLLSA